MANLPAPFASKTLTAIVLNMTIEILGSSMRGPRRVVVTGLGLVSCLGSSVAKNWSRLMKNECGLGPLKRKRIYQY